MTKPRIKKTITTGIYKRTVYEQERQLVYDAATMEAWAKQWNEQPANMLADVLKAVRDVLTQHGVQWDLNGRYPLFRNPNGQGGHDVEPYPDGKEAEIVRDAAGVLKRLAHLEGKFTFGMAEAFIAGRHFERMHVRAFEPLAERGRKSQGGQSKRKKKIRETTAANMAEMKKLWLELWRQRPKGKKRVLGQIDRQVAEHFGYFDPRRIRDARTNNWRPNAKKADRK
jgi:hypothetical protein